ncbi:hypothetical protein BH09BAC1_BH09BAC1_21640 [soil metagenome]
MIYESLAVVLNEINEHLSARVGLFEDRVIMSTLVNPDGSIPIGNENKVVATLVNVAREGIINSSGGGGMGGGFSYGKVPIKLNLYVMFTSCFDDSNYEESLKFLSHILSFFQYKNVFTPQNSDLDGRVRQLHFEIAKLSFHELSNIWAYLGAKYSPSVVYLVRYIHFEEDYVDGIGSAISGSDSSTR